MNRLVRFAVAFMLPLLLAIACFTVGAAASKSPPSPPPWTHKLRKEKDANGEWRWYVKAINGNDIAGSTEGYKNKEDMDKALWALVAAFRDETVHGLP